MVLHSYFFRTIGPAVYGAAAVPATYEAEDWALYLSPTETDVWVIDFESQSTYVDDQSTPGNNKNTKRTKGSSWTTDSIDYLGLPKGYAEFPSYTRWGSTHMPAITPGEDGYLTFPLHNAIVTSEDPSAWTQATASTVQSGSVTTPNGAYAYTTTSSGTSAYVRVTFAGVRYIGMTYCVDFYVKAGTHDIVQIFFGSSQDATSYSNYDLTNGVLGSYGGLITPSITHISDGWYRCRAQFTETTYNGSFAEAYLKMIDTTTDGRNASFGGSSDTIHVWRAQGRYLPSPDEYYKNDDTTYGRSIPTLYCDINGDSLGQYSPYVSGVSGLYSSAWGNIYDYNGNSFWTKNNLTATNDQASPFADNVFDKACLLTGSSSGGTGSVYLRGAVGSLVDTPVKKTCVFYMKPGNHSVCYFLWGDGEDGGGLSNRDSGWFFDLDDLTWERLYGESDAYTEQYGVVDGFSTDHSFYSDINMVRTVDGWIKITVTETFNGSTVTSSNCYYEWGMCDAFGSRTCTLDGKTVYYFGFAGEKNGPTYYNQTAHSYTNYFMDNSQLQTYFFVGSSYAPMDRTGYTIQTTMNMMGDGYSHTLLQTNNTSSGFRIFCSLNSSGISSSSTLTTQWSTSNYAVYYMWGLIHSRFRSYAVSSEANNHTFNMDGQSNYTDTSGTVPGTDYTYLYPNASLIKNIALFNRVVSGADLITLGTGPIVKGQASRLDVSRVRLNVLCSDDIASGAEVASVSVLVLRSTAGT